MATVKSNWITGRNPMPTPVGSEVVNVLLSVEVTAAQTAADTIIMMGSLPENCALVDAVFAADDLDSGSPAMVMSFGTINADEDDLTTTLQAGLTVGQGGAARLTPTVATLGVVGAVNLGYKVTTAAATGVAGTVLLSLSYRATAYGA